jgi:hypothetical protein
LYADMNGLYLQNTCIVTGWLHSKEVLPDCA